MGLEGVLRGSGSGTLPIEELDLEHCNIQPAAGLAIGQFLGKCPHLKTAKLAANRERSLFTVEGLEGVLRGIGSGTLPIEELQLGSCNIQPAAGPALVQLLGKCPQLKKCTGLPVD